VIKMTFLNKLLGSKQHMSQMLNWNPMVTKWTSSNICHFPNGFALYLQPPKSNR